MAKLTSMCYIWSKVSFLWVNTWWNHVHITWTVNKLPCMAFHEHVYSNYRLYQAYIYLWSGSIRPYLCLHDLRDQPTLHPSHVEHTSEITCIQSTVYIYYNISCFYRIRSRGSASNSMYKWRLDDDSVHTLSVAWHIEWCMHTSAWTCMAMSSWAMVASSPCRLSGPG